MQDCSQELCGPLYWSDSMKYSNPLTSLLIGYVLGSLTVVAMAQDPDFDPDMGPPIDLPPPMLECPPCPPCPAALPAPNNQQVQEALKAIEALEQLEKEAE